MDDVARTPFNVGGIGRGFSFSGGLGFGHKLFRELFEEAVLEVGLVDDDAECGFGEGIVGPVAREDFPGGGLGDVEHVPEVLEGAGWEHFVEGDDEVFDELAVELVLHNSNFLCWLAIYRCNI